MGRSRSIFMCRVHRGAIARGIERVAVPATAGCQGPPSWSSGTSCVPGGPVFHDRTRRPCVGALRRATFAGHDWPWWVGEGKDVPAWLCRWPRNLIRCGSGDLDGGRLRIGCLCESVRIAGRDDEHRPIARGFRRPVQRRGNCLPRLAAFRDCRQIQYCCRRCTDVPRVHSIALRPSTTLARHREFIPFFRVYCCWALNADNIWPVMGWHAGWNWLLAVGFELTITGLDVGMPALFVKLNTTAPTYLTGGTQGPEGSFICSLFFAGAIALLIWRLARRRARLCRGTKD